VPDFGPYQLLNCYANGIFPMSESRNDPEIFFVDPDNRGIIPLDALKISKSLMKTVRSGRFEIKTDTAFHEVVKACSEPRPDHPETWINQTILDLYAELHELGYAHSVECWQDDELKGGLYGVTLGTAFFGESMFSHATDASKVALVHLVARLNAGGFTLLDSQFITDHLRSLGGIEITREAYHKRLEAALELQGNFNPGDYSDIDYRRSLEPAGTRQSKTQIS
jgi:leucyl/phenylalanyl-tRNA--protein transferase